VVFIFSSGMIVYLNSNCFEIIKKFHHLQYLNFLKLYEFSFKIIFIH